MVINIDVGPHALYLAHLKVGGIGILIKVAGNTKLIGGSRSRNVGGGIVQCTEARDCDSRSTAGWNSSSGSKKTSSSEVLNRLDIGLQEARCPHATEGAEVSCGGNNIDVGVELLGKRVAEGSDDFLPSGLVLVDIVLRIQHAFGLFNGNAKSHPIASSGTLSGCMAWLDAMVVKPGVDSINGVGMRR